MDNKWVSTWVSWEPWPAVLSPWQWNQQNGESWQLEATCQQMKCTGCICSAMFYCSFTHPYSEKSPCVILQQQKRWHSPGQTVQHNSFPGDFCSSSQLWLGQDLATSLSCSMDRSTSETPTSMPVIKDVSESLLSGGWCSPEGGDRETVL